MPCCFKKSAITEVDPCGQVEKYSTRYEIDKYVVVFSCAVHARCGHIVYLLTMINFTVVISERAFSYQFDQLYCDFLFFSHNYI